MATPPDAVVDWLWPLRAYLLRTSLMLCVVLMVVAESLLLVTHPTANLDLPGLLAVFIVAVLLVLTVEVPALRRLADPAAAILAGVLLVRYANLSLWPGQGGELMLVRANVVLLTGLLVAPSALAGTAIALLALAVPLIANALTPDRLFGAHLHPVTVTLGVGGVAYAWLIHVIRRRMHERVLALQAAADHDDLTGLLNRRGFMAQAQAQVQACFDTGRPAALLYVDADRFKQINDTFGHDTGDRVLVSLAAQLTERAGDDALVGRLGGEEFGVLWPGLDELSCHRRALALQRALRPDAPTPVTVSIGLAADQDPRLDGLIRRAEQGLRAAKESGRDQVVPGVLTPLPEALGSD